MGGFEKCLNIADLVRAAKARAHPMVFDYIDGGADDEVTLRRNCTAYADYELLYRVLAGVETVDITTALMGTKADVPFILSPSAGNRLFHKDGERAVVRAADKMGAIYCLSTLSSVSIEEIGALTQSPKWFQLYVWKDRTLLKEMLDRARGAGFSTLILTADLPTHGNRERDPRNGFTIPPKLGYRQMTGAIKRPLWSFDYLTAPAIRFANLDQKAKATSLESFVRAQLHQAFSWQDVEWLLSTWNGPAVLKGVVRKEDARRAAQAGFTGVMISNHGGRQLDGAPAPISLVEQMRAHVGDGLTLIVDGGVRRGTDMIKAKALGADAVSFARPYLYGLAAGGEAGVMRALTLLQEELVRDMILLGAQRWQDIGRDYVCKRA